MLGGAAHRVELMSRLQNPDMESIVVNAGDVFKPGTNQKEKSLELKITDMSEKSVMINELNYEGCQLWGLGDHDLEIGADDFQHATERFRGGLVANNAKNAAGDPIPRVHDYFIQNIERWNIKIFWTAVVNPSPRLRHPSLTYTDPVKRVLETMAEAKEEHNPDAGIIICHGSRAVQRQLAKEMSRQSNFPCPAIIAGHSHDPGEKKNTRKEKIGPPIVQAMCGGTHVLVVDLKFGTEPKIIEGRVARVIQVKRRMIPVDPAEIPADEFMSGVVSQHLALMQALSRSQAPLRKGDGPR